MRSWPIRRKLLVIPILAVVLLAGTMLCFFESNRRYEIEVRTAVAEALGPRAAAGTGDGEILRTSQGPGSAYYEILRTRPAPAADNRDALPSTQVAGANNSEALRATQSTGADKSETLRTSQAAESCSDDHDSR